MTFLSFKPTYLDDFHPCTRDRLQNLYKDIILPSLHRSNPITH